MAVTDAKLLVWMTVRVHVKHLATPLARAVVKGQADALIAVVLAKAHALVVARVVLQIQDVLDVHLLAPTHARMGVVLLAKKAAKAIVQANVPMAVRAVVKHHVQESAKENVPLLVHEHAQMIVQMAARMAARQVARHRVQ